MAPPFETLRWRDGIFELLDQRALPDRCSYVSLDSAQAVADAIRSMIVRGAPAIGCTAAYGVALEAQRLKQSARAEFDAGMSRAFESTLSSMLLSNPTIIALIGMATTVHTTAPMTPANSPTSAPSPGEIGIGRCCCIRYAASPPQKRTQAQQQFARLMTGSADSTPMTRPPSRAGWSMPDDT